MTELIHGERFLVEDWVLLSATAELARRHAVQALERSRECFLGLELPVECDVDDRAARLGEHAGGLVQAPQADVLADRLSGYRVKQAVKVPQGPAGHLSDLLQ